MKVFVSKFFLLISILIFLAGCQKELSLEDITGAQGGTAVFTLDGAPGNCEGSQVQGNYKQGVAVNSSNVVSLAVNVTTAGTYSISTNSTNGVSFSGSGTFTTPGLQFIQLTATGTPVTAGTFAYKPGTNPCSFLVVVAAAGAGSGGNTGMAVYTLTGSPTTCLAPVITGAYTQGVALTVANTVVLKANVTTVGNYNITAVNNGITFTATGVFTATGANQNVTFTASGTPGTVGNINFKPGAGINGCTFTVPVIAAVPSAGAFTFAGAPGACTAAVITGMYTQGIALNAANTVQLSIVVTSLGAYNITASSAGISFSKAGNFTTLGNQTITLNGSGTPLAAGAISFTPTGAGNAGCLFTVPVGIRGTGFIKARIGATDFEFNSNIVVQPSISSSPSKFELQGDQSLPSGGSNRFAIRFTDYITSLVPGSYHNFALSNSESYVTLVYFNSAGTLFGGNVSAPNSFTCTLSTLTATMAIGTFQGTLIGTDGSSLPVTAGSFSLTY